MTPPSTLTITERSDWTVRVELRGETPATVSLVAPAGPRQEADLRRYLEGHLALAITDPGSTRRAAAFLPRYGLALHAQLRSTPEASRIIERWSAIPDSERAVEIRGTARLQRLHWELLCEPGDDRPLAVRVPVTRTRNAPAPDSETATELRVLIVTARDGGADIGVRVIRRPLLGALGSAVPVNIVRPGTFEALAAALRAEPRGHYPVVHLDMHGRATDDGGLLFFERPGPDGVVGVETAEVATLLGDHGVRLVVLNACQSSMPVGDEASLAALLVRAGVRAAVGMRYSITVDGAVRFSSAFYRALAANTEVAAATRDARAAMYARRIRRTALGIDVELDDWLLPICHQAGPLRFRPAAEPAAPVAPVADLPGRDTVIMDVERRVTAGRPVLVVHGLIGGGKSALLRQLAAEWTSTGFAETCLMSDFEDPGWDAAALRRRLPAAGRWALLIDHPRPANRDDLRALVDDVVQSANPPVAVLIAARHPGGWVPGADGYQLPGLDQQTALALGRAALGEDRHRELLRGSAYRRCVQVLGGNPGALQAVWRVLADNDPRRVLAVLQGGELAGPDVTLRRLRAGLDGLDDREVVERLSPYTGPVAGGRLPAGKGPDGFEAAHRAGLVTVSGDGVVPHPLLGPTLRHALADRPELLAARRAAFLEVYLDFAARHAGDRDAVLAEQENLQTALALALVAGAPETDLVRALDAAFRGSVDRVALYDAVLALVHRNPQQIIYRQQQVYALAGVGRLDDAARAHEQLLGHLDEFARTEPAAAAAARPAILHSGAVLALERGDRTAAGKLLRRALAGAGVDGPNGDAATHFELGRIALDEGQPKTARQHLEAAEPGMRRPPDRHVRVLLMLARAERADGDPDAAARYLEQARLEVSTLDVLIEIIWVSIDSGRLDPAVVVLSEAGALVRDTGGLARLSLVSGALAAARTDDETAAAGYERAAGLAEQIRDTATAIEAYLRHATLVATSDPARAEGLRRRAGILAADEAVTQPM